MVEPDVFEGRRLRLLGVFRVYAGSQAVHIPLTSSRKVLAYVAIHGPCARDRAAGQLWPDSPRAAAELRTALWRIRRACSGILEDNDQVLSIAEDVTLDLNEVGAWADEAMMPSVTLPVTQHRSLPVGAGLDLLPGWHDPWLDEPRARFHMLHIQAYEALAERLLLAGRTGEAFRYALHVCHAEPLRESAQCLMIEIHLRQGNVGEALTQYANYRRRLDTALGILPGLRITSMIAPHLPRRGLGVNTSGARPRKAAPPR